MYILKADSTPINYIDKHEPIYIRSLLFPCPLFKNFLLILFFSLSFFTFPVSGERFSLSNCLPFFLAHPSVSKMVLSQDSQDSQIEPQAHKVPSGEGSIVYDKANLAWFDAQPGDIDLNKPKPDQRLRQFLVIFIICGCMIGK